MLLELSDGTAIEKIEHVSKKLAAIYELLDWKWAPGGGEHIFIPDKHKIKETIIGYIKSLKNDPVGAAHSGGGIEVTKKYFDDETSPIVYEIALDVLTLFEDDVKKIS